MAVLFRHHERSITDIRRPPAKFRDPPREQLSPPLGKLYPPFESVRDIDSYINQSAVERLALYLVGILSIIRNVNQHPV